jgi:hypothetical protein
MNDPRTGRFLSSGLTTEERFLKFVEKTDSCWLWKGSIDKDGYGHFSLPRQSRSSYVRVRASRTSFEIFKGVIPKGLCVCHTCDNRVCVNPNHLFLATNEENTIDKINKGRQLKGEEIVQHKLTEDDIRDIRVLHIEHPDIRHWQIAEYYGVARRTISFILQGNRWKHIE